MAIYFVVVFEYELFTAVFLNNYGSSHTDAVVDFLFLFLYTKPRKL